MATNPVIPMAYKVDWFQATESSENDEILNILDSNLWAFLEEIGYKFGGFEEASPRYFYNSALTLGRYLNIYYDSESKEVNKYSPKNVLFQFTGQGSTDLALKLSEYFNTTDFSRVWFNFFKVVYKYQIKVTRMDVALDDFNARLNFDQMERKLKRKEFRSSKRSYNVVRDKNTNGTIKGETLYLGTRKRHQDGYLIRFYNKFAEYKSKGAILPTAVENIVTGEGTHKWQRYEIEIHGQACANFIACVLGGESFGMIYKGLMRNAIEFLKASRSNKNKNYWQVCDWWEQFLEGAGKCSLAEPERDLNLGRLLRWIRVSVVPSLHLLDEIGQQNGFDIYELIKECEIEPYAKKQERLKNEALNMSQDLIDSYIEAFRMGAY